MEIKIGVQNVAREIVIEATGAEAEIEAAVRTALDGGALVLSEFTGAWHELHQSFVCNPHDIEGLKQTILRALRTDDKERRRLMRALRRRVADNDVQRWADRFLTNLETAPRKPGAKGA